MLFRRKKTTPIPGPAGPVRTGLDAILAVEESLRVSTSVQTGAVGDTHIRAEVRRFADGRSAAAYALGRCAAGRRSAVVLDSEGLRASSTVILDAVRNRIPVVVHLVCRDEWSAALAAGADGAVVLVTPDLRDIPAMTVAAHRVAESVLLPVVCVHDATHVAFGSADIAEPDNPAALLPEVMPSAGGQHILFGHDRPAVPAWIDADRPMGVGARLDGTDDVAGAAGAHLFLDDELGERIDRALAVVADALRRPVHGLEMRGGTRGASVFVSAGPMFGVLSGVADEAGAPMRAAGCTRLVPPPSLATQAADAPAVLLIAARPGPLSDQLARSAGDGRAVVRGFFAGGAGLPTAEDVRALVERVRSDPDPGRPVFVGAWRPVDRPGIPEAERLGQRLRAVRPDVDRHVVHAHPSQAGASALLAVGPLVADLLAEETAQALAAVATVPVRTARIATAADAPLVGLVHGPGAERPVSTPAPVLVAESAAHLDRVGLQDVLAEGGAVIVPDPARISGEAAGRIRDRHGRLFGLTEDTDPAEPFDAPLRLLVAALRITPGVDGGAVSDVARGVVSRLHAARVLSDERADRLLAGVPDTAAPVRAESAPGRPEPQPPSILHGDTGTTERMDDPARFWRIFGYAAATGRTAELPPDPYRAVGALPSRAGWAPGGSGYPPMLPGLVPERCTGCGACWTVCPESAILPAAPGFQAALDTAFDRLALSGGEAFQLGRLTKVWVPECHRVFRDDALRQFGRLDALVREALERVMTRAKIDDAKREELLVEFSALEPHLPPLSLVNAEPWFGAQERQTKGAGRPLVLALDPDRCTACGACVALCPEAALEPVAATDERLEAERLGAAFTAALPPLPAGTIETAAAVEPASRQLERRALHAAAGGDGPPLRRSAIRAVAVAAEALRAPAFDRFAERVRDARENVETAIQREVAGVVSINDFEAFAHRLSRMGGDLTPDRLAATASNGTGIDSDRIAGLTGIRARLVELEDRLGSHEGRARLIAVFDGPDRPTWPVNPYAFPWIRVAAGSGPSVLAAVADETAHRHLADVALVRHAERLATDTAESADIPPVDAASLTPEESAARPEAVLFTGRLSDGVLPLLEGDVPVRVVLLRQDPGTAEAGDPAVTAAALGTACVVQSSPAHPGHLVDGLETALTAAGPSLVCLHVPDGPAPEALRRATEAVDARVAPLFTYRPDRLSAGELDLSANPSPDADFVVDDGRSLTPVSWMAREPARGSAFRFAPEGEGPVDAVDVSRILDGSVAAGTPVVRGPRGQIAVVPAEALSAATRLMRSWRRLRTLVRQPATGPTVASDPPPASAGAPAEPEPVPADAHARLTARLLALSGFGPGRDVASQKLREVLTGAARDGG